MSDDAMSKDGYVLVNKGGLEIKDAPRGLTLKRLARRPRDDDWEVRKGDVLIGWYNPYVKGPAAVQACYNDPHVQRFLDEWLPLQRQREEREAAAFHRKIDAERQAREARAVREMYEALGLDASEPEVHQESGDLKARLAKVGAGIDRLRFSVRR